MANRSLEGVLSVTTFSIRQTPLGLLSAHFVWQGTLLRLTNLELALPAGTIQGSGDVALSAHLPRYHFALKLDGYPWGGGILAAEGHVESSGMGLLALQNMQAAGAFSGEGLVVAGADPFDAVSGQFSLGFAGTTAFVRLTKLAARQNDEDWSGAGTSGDDGKLHLDLTSGDKQQHLVTDWIPAETEAHAPLVH
jgi:hypothetical protein